MILLATRADIAKYRQISKSVLDAVLNQYINDAQFVDVQQLMGAEFFNDMLRNYTAANYQALLKEASYVHETVTYTNYGLIAVISLYSYSRYILFGGYTDTPFGFVQKVTDESQPVSYNDRKSAGKDAQQNAFYYWENVRDFLNRNEADYPLWKNDCRVNKKRFKISKIG